MQLKNLLQLFLLLIFTQFATAQVKSVNYQLRFNHETNLFDCYLIIKEGNAKNMRHRTQFNSQYTLVVPTGSKAEIVKNYMPLQNNQEYKGFQPMEWVISNQINKPSADPFHDYLSIVPTLSPASFYNDLNEGDAVRLFSVRILPVTDCGASVKIYEQGIDLHSGERGMYGGDFSNGFTIGGIEQKYAGNAPQVIPSLNAVSHIDKIETSGLRLSAVLKTSVNSQALKFEWSGPNGFTSSTKDVMIPYLTSKHYGTYKLTVSDERGCKEEHSVEIKSPKIPIVNDQAEIVKTELNPVKTESREKPFTREGEENLLETVSSIKIYPNPAQNYFTIQIEAKAGLPVSADIADASGRLLRKSVLGTNANGSVQDFNISLQDIQPGLYNIIVKTGDEESVHKLIVVK